VDMTETHIEHRRGTDRELVGWIRPSGEDFVAVDLLGRDVTGEVDWLDAEEALEELGIGYLADAYELRLESGEWLRVRVTEVTPETIGLTVDDGAFNVIGGEKQLYSARFPLDPNELRPAA
ncbi:MAG: hypothetical protein ACTIKB_10885, partial [Agrococcus casei]|uniref:hypothetical protein n=2 Tax=Agrococcus casei TaxID=343512 RepID=UPI003F9D2147